MNWLCRLRARSVFLLFLAILGMSLLDAAPALAQANAPVGGGGTCSYSTEGDGTVGQQQAYDNGLYTCLSSSSTWTPEAFIVGSVLQNGSAATCSSSTYAGMLQWTGSALQYCNGSSWITLAGSASGLDLGTSASATNPQRTGDASTGLFSPATSTVAVSAGGTEEMRVNTTGVGIGTTSLANKLDVYGSAAFGTYGGTSAGSGNVIVSGDIGIGSTVPAAALDVTGQVYSRRSALTYASTITVNWQNGNVQSVTLTGNPTITFSNGQDGGRYILIVKQDGTGSRTVTWSNANWPGGTAPTLTTTASKWDYITFIYNGVSSTYDGVAISQNF
jgi:hypothetical protein